MPTQEMRKQEVVAGKKRVVVVRGGRRRRRRQEAIETNVPSFPFLTGRKVFLPPREGKGE